MFEIWRVSLDSLSDARPESFYRVSVVCQNSQPLVGLVFYSKFDGDWSHEDGTWHERLSSLRVLKNKLRR